MAKSEYTTLEVAGREVRLSNPAKVYFPKPGWTKLDVVEYYLAVADAALVHVRERPGTMKRFVNGIMEDPIWQKRVPKSIPDWLQTATVDFPSGRTAEELVANDAAHLAWAVNLGVIDFNPWPARRAVRGGFQIAIRFGDDDEIGQRGRAGAAVRAGAFDAMTAGRPYRPAISQDEAVAELRACAGSQFDAIVVEAFCGALAETALAM